MLRGGVSVLTRPIKQSACSVMVVTGRSRGDPEKARASAARHLPPVGHRCAARQVLADTAFPSIQLAGGQIGF
jgi:hypothetical protein